MIADAPPAFTCVVATATDGDTIRCADGQRVRIAGIEANERKGGCHLPVCPPLPHARAKPIVERLVLGKTLTCHPLGTSYARIVARCTLPDRSDLACSIVTLGAAEWWPGYVRRYGLKTRC